MKLFQKAKDGGPESTVTGYFVIEWKRVFSVVLLKFSEGSRNAYHNHAFGAYSWLLKGQLREWPLTGKEIVLNPSIRWIYTPRNRFHKVISIGNSYVLSFRGPWAKKWTEWRPSEGRFVTLTYGRKEV